MILSNRATRPCLVLSIISIALVTAGCVDEPPILDVAGTYVMVGTPPEEFTFILETEFPDTACTITEEPTSFGTLGCYVHSRNGKTYVDWVVQGWHEMTIRLRALPSAENPDQADRLRFLWLRDNATGQIHPFPSPDLVRVGDAGAPS